MLGTPPNAFFRITAKLRCTCRWTAMLSNGYRIGICVCIQGQLSKVPGVSSSLPDLAIAVCMCALVHVLCHVCARVCA